MTKDNAAAQSAGLTGRSFIGTVRGGVSGKTYRAFDPTTGEPIAPNFYSASTGDVNQAVGLATAARTEFAALSGKAKGAFLRQVADNLTALGDELIDRACLESGLPKPRIKSERMRTCLQLIAFAELVEEGSWVDARIDRAELDRKPFPKPDVRSMQRALGPVAIFCASNFPLAFSVAGGDTASAWAAGCPVVVNGHPAHPGTAELVGIAINGAVKSCSLPEGAFSLLFSGDYEVGQALVRHPDICAVGFTGSLRGGRALMDLAAARPSPIPVYAEMGSVNPTFILPGALAARSDEISTGLVTSFTMGTGQFCTKPGLVVLPNAPQTPAFSKKVSSLATEFAGAPLLTGGIKANYLRGVGERAEILNDPSQVIDGQGFSVGARVFETSAAAFAGNHELAEEVFGPTTLLVHTGGREELLELARGLEGQLTATIFGEPEELVEYADLIAILEQNAGRLIFNAFPTGVEVCSSMVHGGPYPATSAPGTTSVGTRAIYRFARPVCYQGFPQASLPDELKEENLLGIWRLVDGQFGR
jgi:NADP-dependent aldehyde dehydrogenase